MQTFLTGGSLWGNRSREAFPCFLWSRARHMDGHGTSLSLSNLFTWISHHSYHKESKIWWLWQVLEKNKEIEAIWRVDALQRILKEVHSLFVMFHGSVRALLDKEPTGGLTRSHLYPFITDYLNGKAISIKSSKYVISLCHSTCQ